ncbi:MAG TPA: tetratricopeptide repeat protein [Acidobacteriota bacterium]|nr:tetratricopeptide repeat protein [Acidobacteriota bacterium]
MKRSPILFFFLIFCTRLLAADTDNLHRERVRAGLEAIYELDYAQAQKIFDQLRTEHPESPVGYGMLAVTAWHELLFASKNLAVYEYGIPTPFGSGVPSSKSITRQQEHFAQANKILQEVCEKLLAKNPRDVLALYFKGLSYENLSIEALTLHRRQGAATSYAKKASNIHKEVLQLDPNLIDANTSIAVPEYVVGTANWGLRFLALLLGLRGDKKGALARLQSVSERGVYRATDALVVMALLEGWRGDPQRAVSIFARLRQMYPRSFLSDIGLAVAHENAGDPKAAVQVYQELLRDLPAKAPGIRPAEIHFRTGKSYVRLRDYSLALNAFQKALEEPPGDLETRPLAYYQMALIHEERGEKSEAQSCFRKVAEYSGPNIMIEKEIARSKKKLS